MPRIVSSRIVLAVQNLQASTTFYIEALGFQRDFGDGSDGWSFLSRGAFRVMLGECPNEPPASELGDHSYIAYLVVDDIDGFYRELKARGVASIDEPADQPWGIREFGLTTPDGHRMHFGQPIQSHPPRDAKTE